MLTAKDLFSGYKDLDLFTEDIAVKGVRPNLDGVDLTLAEIIKKCWDKDPRVRPTFKELIPILQAARVDINLPTSLCPTANALWKSKFLSNSKIGADLFMRTLSVELGKPDNVLHKNLLNHLILKKSSNDFKSLTTAKLSKVIKWFGPLKQGESTLFQKLELVMKEPWFFGTIDSSEAENILERNKKDGLFLVRLNVGGGVPITTSPFTISRVEKGVCVHTRVYPSSKGEAGFYIKIEGDTTKVPGSIVDLILVLQSTKKNICGAVAEGNPFSSLFLSKPKKKGAYQVNDNETDDL
jgi:hypothetical protein